MSEAEIPNRESEKSGGQNDMQKREAAPQTHATRPSAKPLNPDQSAYLEKIRTILGRWTEPVLVAYGNYARNPKQGPTLEKMLQICCDGARQIANAAGVAIAFADGPNLICGARSGELVSAIGARTASEAGFPGSCVKSHQVFISHSALTDPRVDPEVRRRGIKSLIAIPVIRNNHVLAVLEVFSLTESAFNVTHILSLQFLANLVGGALSELQQSKCSDMVWDGKPVAPAAPTKATVSFPTPANVVSANASQLQEEAARTERCPQTVASPVSGLQSEREIVEPRKPTELASQIKSASTTSSTERRRQLRIAVDSIAYVSLGDENGGILLDIHDAGFSMQTALPLDGGNTHLRRARFSGDCDFEINCGLVWYEAGKAGFKFCNVSDSLTGLQSWIAANGIHPLSVSDMRPTPQRTQFAAALAHLDELRSMLLNSKLTKDTLRK